jgi:hypothetical protein
MLKLGCSNHFVILKKMLQYLCLALLISSVINAEVLVYPLNLYHVDSGKFTTELYFQKFEEMS